jgi:hypothetical protein
MFTLTVMQTHQYSIINFGRSGRLLLLFSSQINLSMLSIQLQLRMAPVEKDECQNTAIKKLQE